MKSRCREVYFILLTVGLVLCNLQFAQAKFGWLFGGSKPKTESVENKTNPNKSEKITDDVLLDEIERMEDAFSFFREERERLRRDIQIEKEKTDKLENTVDFMSEKLVEHGEPVPEVEAELRAEAEELKASKLQGVISNLKEQLKQRDAEIFKLRKVVDEQAEKLARKSELNSKRKAKIKSKEPEMTAFAEELELQAVLDEDFDVDELDELIPASVVVSPKSLVAAARGFLEIGDIKKAENAFARVLKIDAESLPAIFGLATCSYKSGDYKTAKMHLVRLAKLDASHANGLGLLGMVELQNGNYNKALKLISKALKTEPKNAQLHNYYGILKHSKNELEAAAISFRTATDLDPLHAEAHFNLTVILVSLNPPKLKEAKKHYEKALRLGNEKDLSLEKILNP